MRYPSKNKPIKLLVMMFLIVLAVCILVAGAIYYVDPFFHYHAPLSDFPYVVDNQLTQNPGMAEHMEYDSVILGSSMTVNFETDWFSELMDLNTLKLSYSSAYPKDISNILEKIYEPYDDGREKNIKAVFLGLDIVTYSGDVNETKYPLPEYLYDDNPINDINYLLNKDVLLNYVLRPLADPEPTNLSHVYASWWTDDYYNEDWVLSNHEVPETREVPLSSNAFDDGIRKNLDANIIPYIEAHPETEYYIFFPPYSILFWDDVLRDNRYEATLSAYNTVCEALLKYDNVRMFFFPDKEDTVTDLNNYADYTHYHPSVNRFMAECFVSGEYEILRDGTLGTDSGSNTRGTVNDHLQNMRDIVNRYDFNELDEKLEKWRN